MLFICDFEFHLGDYLLSLLLSSTVESFNKASAACEPVEKVKRIKIIRARARRPAYEWALGNGQEILPAGVEVEQSRVKRFVVIEPRCNVFRLC